MASSLEDQLKTILEDLQDSKDLTDRMPGDPLPEPPQADVQGKMNSAKSGVDEILDPNTQPNIPGTPTPVIIPLPIPLTWTNGIAQLVTWAQSAVDEESNQSSGWEQRCADACGSIQSGWQAVYDLT